MDGEEGEIEWVPIIKDKLSHNSSVTVKQLHFQEENMGYLVRHLKPKHKELTIEWGRIGWREAEILSRAQECSHLRKIYLNGNQVGNKGC